MRLCLAALVLVRNSIKFIGVIDSRANQYVFAQQSEREYEQEQLRQNKHLFENVHTDARFLFNRVVNSTYVNAK